MSEARSKPLRDVSDFKRDVLAAVGSLDEPSGRDVQKYLSRSYGDVLRENRVYRNLRELEEAGYVDIDDELGLTNTVELTDLGAQSVRADHDWRRLP